MADLRISELPVLLPEDLEANDDLAVADYSASLSRRVTTKGLVEKAVSDLIDDGTIPGVKIADASITATQIADNAIGADQLADDAIAAVAIGDGTITGAKLAADTITAANIAADAVTASELADDAVDTASIVDGAVTGAKIAADTITASNIAADAVGASELADNAVDTASIVNSAVTTDKLGAGAVTAIKIESGTITSAQIATGTIATSNIQDAAVTGGKIASGTITGSNIASATITAANIADNAIGADQLADDAIAAVAIGDGTITGTKIAADTITAANIATDAVGASELADDAVDTGAIVDGAVTNAKLATDAVGSTNIAADAVTSTKIAAGAVGTTQLADDGVTNAKVASGVDGAKISDNTIAAAKLTTDALDRGLDRTSGSIGITNEIAPGTQNGITYNEQGLITSTAALDATDLPIANTTQPGAVIVASDSGLAVTGGGEISIANSVAAATVSGITFDEFGSITAATGLVDTDLPLATNATVGGVIVPAGGGLDIDGGANVSLVDTGVAAGEYTKVTVNAKGVVTEATTLGSDDIPEISAALLTSGTIPIARLASNSITGEKLSNSSVCQFGGSGSTAGVVTFPVAQYTGQFFFDSLNGDLYIWDGNAWQPVTITSGEIIFAGTYDASTNLVASTTTVGAAAGLTAGSVLPAASSNNNQYYVVVSVAGTGTSPAPAVLLNPPDILISNGTTWELLDVSGYISSQQASNISVVASGGISSTDAQAALEELDSKKLAKAGGTITGTLEIGNAGALVFEGSTDDGFETTIAVADPTADRTIKFPDATGNVVTTGDSGTVTSAMIANGTIANADISATAAIAFSKLAALTGGHIIVGNSSNVPTAVAVSGDITLSNTGVASIASGAIVNEDVNASAAIAGSKIQAATTSNAGVVQLNNTISSTSTTLAATANAVRTAYDLAALAMPKAGGTFTGAVTINADLVMSNGEIIAAAGTEAAPSIAFTGDTNTGLYSPGADQVAISTNGTGRLFVDASGQVGFGAASPQEELHIAAADSTIRLEDISVSGLYHNIIAASNAGLRFDVDPGNVAASSFFRIDIDGGEKARITSDGRLGLGASSPSSLLHLHDSSNTMLFLESSDSIADIIGADTTGSTRIRSDAGKLSFWTGGDASSSTATNASEAARIDSDGVVIIGATTSTGGQKLKIQGRVGNSNAGAIAVLARGNTPPTAGQALGILSFSDHEENRGAEIRGESDNAWSSNNYGGRLILATTALDGLAPLDRWEIDRSGQLTSLSDGGGIDCAPIYSNTTSGNTANVYIGPGGVLQRADGSSIKYKKDVETIEDSYADAILDCRPVWYRSICSGDCPDHSFWGFIAEEVAEIDPRLVHFKTVNVTFENGKKIETPCDPEPESVHYNRFVPHLVNLVKRQRNQIQSLEDRLAALEAKLQ